LIFLFKKAYILPTHLQRKEAYHKVINVHNETTALMIYWHQYMFIQNKVLDKIESLLFRLLSKISLLDHYFENGHLWKLFKGTVQP
jgi:hypothetical protein